MATVDLVLEKIGRLHLEEGERLPSERVLAESCGVSRTSMRNALKELQSRRILKVKQGSGYFLASQFALEQAVAGLDDLWDTKRILATMEARHLVQPHVIAVTMTEISASGIEQLEQCLIALGEATVGHDFVAAVSLNHSFFKIIHSHCPNREFIRMLNEVRIPNRYSVAVVAKALDAEVNAIFSEHVNLFQQVKAHDAEGAKATCQSINRQVTALFKKYGEEIDY